jgi:hypothetical protein
MALEPGSLTRQFRYKAEIAESVEEIRALLQQLTQRHNSWSAYLGAELESRGLTSSELAKRAGITRQGVDRWRNQGVTPGTRLMYLKLGMALEMDREQVDFMLQRYGRYPKLYAKNLDDALCIYAINAYRNHLPESEPYHLYPFGHVEALRRTLREEIGRWENEGRLSVSMPTSTVADSIARHLTDAAFVQFVRQNKEVFLSPGYWRLTKMIDDFIRIQQIDALDTAGNVTLHGLIDAGILNASLERLSTNLKTQNEVPSRMRLIAMGLSFNMTTELIDHMLILAGMEPLYARDRVELVVIFGLEVAHLFDPTMEYEIALKLANQNDDPTIREHCTKLMAVNENMVYEERGCYCDFYGVCDYIRYFFTMLDMNQEAEELLSLLPGDAT